MVEMKTLNCLCLCLLLATCACRRSSYSSSQGYSSSGYNSSQEYSGGNNTGFQQFCVKAFATITQIVMLLPTVTTGDVSQLALLAELVNGKVIGAGAQFVPYLGAGANVLGPPVGVIVSNTNDSNKVNITITNPTYQPISFVITKPSVILCSLLAKFGIFKDTDFQYGPALRVLYVTRDVLAAGINKTIGSNVTLTSIATKVAPPLG